MEQSENKFYNGTNDQVFKAIFCNEKDNNYMLKTLIERCLKKEIKIIEVKPPELLKENIYVKGKTVDVYAEVDNEICLIELNCWYYDGLHRRNAAYVFSKYSSETKVGEDYKDMKHIKQINLSCGLPNKYPILGEYELIDKKTGLKYIDNLIIYEYNIDKIKKEYKKGNKEYNFLAMLKAEPKELKEMCKGDEFMEKFKNEVEELNKDPEFVSFLTAEEDARKVHNTLIRNAKEEGIIENKIEIAKNMLKEKIDISIIKKVTGLTEKQVEALK